MFIPDLDPDLFLAIPDPGVKNAPDPGSGSATLLVGHFTDFRPSGSGPAFETQVITRVADPFYPHYF